MLQVHSHNELSAQIQQWKKQGLSIAFVPTMGNLHQGHLSLLKLGREQADKLVSSIFVNPMQFGPNEDLDSYPRSLELDCKGLMEHGCDLVYLPTEQDLYPQGLEHISVVQVPDITSRFEGEFRPGHLTGVSTIVLKLFNLVQPDLAIFGKKDYQQWRMINKMVQDLNLGIDILGGETVREKNGVAMSSRNQYLSDSDRDKAAIIYQQLSRTAESIRDGEIDFANIRADAIETLKQSGYEVDYFDICGRTTLQPGQPGDELVIVVAAKIGQTRLIDNIEV